MRHRNMFNITGLPGWMRFGYSPGWSGRGGRGLGPCAQFLMAGQWPAPQAEPFQTNAQAAGFDASAALKRQADLLRQQLEQINARIAELETAKKETP